MNSTEHLLKVFAGHELETVVEDGPVPCWRLTRPDAPNADVLITSTPGGIVLQCKGLGLKKGRTSDMTLGSFVGELEPDYLASKFLTRKWCPITAAVHFSGLLRKIEADGDEDDWNLADKLRAKRRTDSSIFDSMELWYAGLSADLDPLVERDSPLLDRGDITPPAEYPSEQIHLLTALHTRFRETFMAAYRLVGDKPVRRE